MIRTLDFDSTLFGYPVGALTIGEGGCTETEAQQILRQEGAAYRLVYLFSPEPLGTFGEPVDIKLTFIKTPLAQLPAHEAIHAYTGGDDQRLLQLAFDSGVYSRFHTDPGFSGNEFQQLYRLWMVRSIRGEIADAVLVYNDGTGNCGMVTVAAENQQAEIGLIAVDGSVRGKGIGKLLIAHAETFAAQQGCSRLLVATQAANTPAVSIYLKTGFTEYSRIYIYHRWQQQ
jgi:dTDP-4-amino-4,6-dideoxy-D-galactose acyltransferase